MEQGLQLVHHCLCCSFLSLQGSCQDPAQASHGIRTLGIPLLRCGLLQVDFCSLCSREIPAPAPGASPDPSAPTCGLQGCAPTFLTPLSSSSCFGSSIFPFLFLLSPSHSVLPMGSARGKFLLVLSERRKLQKFLTGATPAKTFLCKPSGAGKNLIGKGILP